MSDKFAIACLLCVVAAIAVGENSPWLAFFIVLVVADLIGG